MAEKQQQAGDKAPDFEMVDTSGKTIRLSDYKSTSVLLVFFRYAGCPWCNLAIHRLAMENNMLKKQGCQVIAFVQSDAESIKQNIMGRHELKPQFPIIADPDRKIYNQYGVRSSRLAAARSVKHIPEWVHAVKKHGFKQEKVSGDLFLVPASFLVASRTQKIVSADYSTSFYDFESFFKIYESLIFHQA